MIRLNDAVKIYRQYQFQTTALNHVSLSIEKGEMAAIVGPSGSGKSTLLNILGGMDRLSSGEYYFEGEKVSEYDRKKLHLFRRQNIGFVFQNFALINRYTVYENMEIPLLARNQKKYDDKIMECLERLKIKELAKQYPARMSGGQQQRCAIARALMTDCKLLLCDEPTGSLDYETGQEIMDILCELNREGKTILVVTHDAKVADRCRREIRLSPR